MIKLHFMILLTASIFLSIPSQSGLLYTYPKLVLKDLEEMSKLIQTKIKESRNSNGDKTIPLKEALQAVYSRPDDDNTIEKVISALRGELNGLEAWESSLESLVDEGLGALKNPQNFKKEALVTYEIFFKNLLETELNPKIEFDFERRLMIKIRDSKVELSRAALQKGALDIGKPGFNPSLAAGKLIEVYEKKMDEQRKKKDREAKEALKNQKSKPSTGNDGTKTPSPTPNDSYL